MTKKQNYFLIGLLILSGVLLFLSQGLRRLMTDDAPPSPPQQKAQTHVINSDTLQLDGKKVIGLPPGQEKEKIHTLKVLNVASADWEENLEKTLRLQGGEDLKEIELQKVDSFVWAQDGIALFVESVIVTIKNDNNVSSTFRVLVDAQNGKILRNWDQPIIDHANPKDNFKLKLDPRYHQE